MKNPNIDKVWQERKALEQFRNVERSCAHWIATHGGASMPVLFQVKR